MKQWETFDVEELVVYKLEISHEYGGVNYRIPEEGKWIFYLE
ncbi:MAG TPA: hypothetical protein VK087_08670 [Tissierellaceae bacterium]|nr:hypothetical protein [Tissierellaceae bacterium]